MNKDIYQVWFKDNDGRDYFVFYTEEDIARDLAEELEKSSRISSAAVNGYTFRPLNKPVSETKSDILIEIA